MFVPKLGVSLHCVWPLVTPEVIAAVAQSQIATLEIFPSLFAEDRAGAIAALNSLFSTSPVCPMTIHSVFGGEYDLSSPNPAIRQRAFDVVYDALELAQTLGASMIVLHASGELTALAERDAHAQQTLSLLTEVAPAFRDAGVRGALELLPRSCLCNTPDELNWFLDRLPPESFGVCLDVNHAMDRFAALPDFVRALGPRLITTHLSDYDGVDEKHWMPGRGIINWAALMQALADIDYQGPFNYECQGDGASPEERVRSFEQNFGWLAGLLGGTPA